MIVHSLQLGPGAYLDTACSPPYLDSGPFPRIRTGSRRITHIKALSLIWRRKRRWADNFLETVGPVVPPESSMPVFPWPGQTTPRIPLPEWRDMSNCSPLSLPALDSRLCPRTSTALVASVCSQLDAVSNSPMHGIQVQGPGYTARIRNPGRIMAGPGALPDRALVK